VLDAELLLARSPVVCESRDDIYVPPLKSIKPFPHQVGTCAKRFKPSEKDQTPAPCSSLLFLMVCNDALRPTKSAVWPTSLIPHPHHHCSIGILLTRDDVSKQTQTKPKRGEIVSPSQTQPDPSGHCQSLVKCEGIREPSVNKNIKPDKFFCFHHFRKRRN